VPVIIQCRRDVEKHTTGRPMLPISRSHGSAVGTATGNGPVEVQSEFKSQRVKIFHFFISSKPALGPTKPWIPGTPRTGDQSDTRTLPTQRTTQTQYRHRRPCLELNLTHDFSFSASEVTSCLKPLGLSDRLISYCRTVININKVLSMELIG
jgi:hypothetical protein